MMYDVDNDGIMDKEEVRHFVKEYMPSFLPGFVYSHKAFELMFLKIDDDSSGTVDRQELAIFVINLLMESGKKLSSIKDDPSPALQEVKKSVKL